MHVIRKTLAVAAILGFLFSCGSFAPPKNISKNLPARREDVYNGYTRSSHYLEMRDGILLAVDIYRPTRGGQVHIPPLPAVWIHTPYFRALQGPDGKTLSLIDSPIGKAFSENGYVMIIADVRGTGASFGVQEGIFTPDEGKDAYEITEWIAGQLWCNGNVGMIGGSYDGVSQLIAAAEEPPHLKAIFPAMALFDLYSLAYHGGVFYDSCLRQGDAEQRRKIAEMGRFVAPVDDDVDRGLFNQATASRELRRGRSGLFDMFAPLPFRDSLDPYTGSHPYRDWNPASRIADIRKSGVAVYVYGGWFDLFTRDAFLLYVNLRKPKKILVTDTAHKGRSSPESLDLYIAEQIRWFDYWLKGIDNGVMDEPPVALQRVDGSLQELERLSKWPPPDLDRRMLFFHDGHTRGIDSINDGELGLDPPEEGEGADVYAIDYTTTSGPTSRWANAVKKTLEYADMAGNDRRALTYTTRPLDQPVTVLGHPIVSFWIKTDSADTDLFVYLEDIDRSGFSRYVTEGSLRTSHRKRHKAPCNNLGLPYRRHFGGDAEPIPRDRMIEIRLDLLPTFYRFDRGHRIRVALTGADADNALTPKVDPPPIVQIYHTPKYPSGIALPIKDAGK